MSTSRKGIVRVSRDGRVTLPKAVRAGRAWEPGTRLLVEDTPEGVLLRKASAFAPTRPEDVFGCLPWNGPELTIEEMDEAVLAEAADRARDEGGP
ncbi:AbrB/MazE/SpoVT family DNA-binding domain-containing protein [Salinarimonas sp. NSM]|uniref:AbrB/MazE/SpoVT family DNA-binding domain-containing protein n=1 Tax=Salinarimonas sp. NSM TaxID=3458003 RepID=UPI0040351EB0